ncbi:LCP family protein [Streptomyces zingiberis]|uniref:LCP family protein n=1 Tax=Streptomyces zingiberis TaxID=2053010 RepID=A0ABX1C6Y8_9ACTN|nr:LCP family protein [Streptomyces zingiberis]NJQ02719.1 LCP family protein [Streptomyces zingiberis]
MDAQGRGRADDIDPADQWVLDPDTGNYVLRLQAPTERPAAPGPRRASGPPAAASAASDPAGATGQGPPGQGARGTAPRAGSRRAAQAAPEREESRAGAAPQRGRRAAGRAAPKTAAGSNRRKRRQQKAGRKKALLWTGGVMAFVLLAGGGGAYYVFERINGNLNTVDVGDAGSDTITDGPMNILVLGTDVRTGKGNEGYGDKGSVGHADTTILFHVSEDRTNATALSIPRDMLTDVPDCPTKQEDGSTEVIPGERSVRFNTSLGQSGRDPGCTMRTVEGITGLEVDHFMMADFNAVKTLSTAVGGVEVCLAKPIDDPKSHLKLSEGKHVVEGDDALAFVRTRYGLQFGSDLDRIKLQQQFLSSMIRKMKSGDTLTDPKKLWDLADAATKALTVDTGIGSVNKLIALANNLKKVNIKNISFVTVPVLDSEDKASVVLNKQPADQLFAMLRDDISLTEVKKKEKAEEKAEEKAKTEGPKAEPSEVRVDVFNGGAPIGAAQTTVDWLQNTEGVNRSANGGNSGSRKTLKKTVLEYTPDQADQARALAEMMGLSAAAMKPSKDGGGSAETGSMTLTLGEDFTEPGVPLTAPSKAPENIQRVEADQQVCAK